MARYEIQRSQLNLQTEIGRGEFGLVMKAIATDLPSCEPMLAVAVKAMHAGSSPYASNAFIREASRLSDLNHPNVVRLLAVCLETEPYLIVLEYLSYGDLKSLLRLSRSPNLSLDKSHLISLALDVSQGFHYLQQKLFVHRDLAARNVLVSSAFVAKIGDFGMSRRIYNSDYYMQSGDSLSKDLSTLPLRWMAPESYFDNVWDLRSDAWMFGVLLWGL